MLQSLHIENYVLIDSLDISFPEGLIIITGQTGAGKSILLGALSLLTGAKADAGLISQDADSLVVEAEFRLPDANPELRELLEESDVEFDGNSILIRRVVHKSGRARAFVNDSPVAAGVLSEMAAYLIDIHSQHQNLLLSKGNFQLSLLDHFAHCDALAEDCAQKWTVLKDSEKQLETAKARLLKATSEADFNRASLDRLVKARLVDGELEDLEEEQKSLANAGEIKSDLSQASELLDLGQQLRDAQRALDKVAQYIPAARELSSRLESSRIELEDISYEVDKRNSSLSVSEGRLEEVEDRISTLLGLMRKTGTQSVAEMIALRDSLEHEVTGLSDMEATVADLADSVGRADKDYRSAAEALHKKRLAAAPLLEAALQNNIRALELERAVFKVDVNDTNQSARGIDSCVFRFDSNGNTPAELSKCASGGEMSRIMLCIKEMMARYGNMPTMIFDEIDTGVSGSVAHKMGKLICDMGSRMQVFAITHLPQVAAKGDAHYVVQKSLVNGRTVSSLRQLGADERLNELARLLSGENITPEALANARALLSEK